MSQPEATPTPLWSDNPADRDLLGFTDIAAPALEALERRLLGGLLQGSHRVVHLRGRILGGSGNNVIFQLPAGYRPAAGKVVGVAAACECTAGQATIDGINGSGFAAASDGAVVMVNGTLSPGNSSLWLDGISFRAES